MLALATGTRVGASDHATRRFCIECGCVPEFYTPIHYFVVLIVRINEQSDMFYICGCDAYFVINSFLLNSGLPCLVSMSICVSRKRSWRGGGNPRNIWFRSMGGSASFRGPPRTSPCPSPSLGASRVGCGPCPTCGHAALRRAGARAGGAATRPRKGREA